MRHGTGDPALETHTTPTLTERVVRGLARRGRHLLPGERRIRRVPFGITAGLKLESSLHDLAYFPLGLYEVEIHRWLRKFAPVGGRAFDIGAADGTQALALARLTERPVVAFEADADSLSGLEAHLAANPGLQVHTEASFVGAGDDGTVALDTYPGEPATLLKIDVEGAELDVLHGAERLLREHRPHLIIETHTAQLEADILDLLRPLGYSPTIIDRRRWLREDRPMAHNRWLAAQGAPPTR